MQGIDCKTEKIELTAVPDNYYSESTEPGTLEAFTYTSRNYYGDGSVMQKKANVYLPYNYDESKHYNIFYLLHGGGGNPDTYMGSPSEPGQLKNLIDNMIERHDIEAMIFVMPTFYTTRELEVCRKSSLEFQEELVTDLIPAIETHYASYAGNGSIEELINSREHRIIGGFSMGGVTTWHILTDATAFFRYYMPMSSDCWKLQAFGGRDLPDQTAKYIHDRLIASRYTADEYYIFAATGTLENPGMPIQPQITAMKAFKDTFRYSEEDFFRGNFMYYSGNGYPHDYVYTYEYIYNGLRSFKMIFV